VFDKRVLKLDPAAEVARISNALCEQVLAVFRRRGAIVGISGGVDSAVVAALCVRTFGRDRVLGLLMPERDCSSDALRLGRLVADQLGIKTLTIERRGRKREEHDREIVSALQDERVDLICLAGYMRVLSPFFVDAFNERILNIHPSLLPAFPGLEPQRQALDHGAHESGCTVHVVDNTLDGGPIIAQRTVPVVPGDTVESLSARILEQEHLLYPEAVASVLDTLKRKQDG